MNEMIIRPFVEGFIGAFRLAIDLFVAVARAIATVSSDFVNNRSRESSAKTPNARLSTPNR